MDLGQFEQLDETTWQIQKQANMRVPAVIYADRNLMQAMDQKVYEQITNVAGLPGIVKAAYAMPDAHWGYGFPIGGVAAFDPDEGGVISAGGVGFDISCGVRTLHTGLTINDIGKLKTLLANELYQSVPAGLGSKGHIHLNQKQMNAMLTGGARWAVERGYGQEEDLHRIEEHGCMAGAEPAEVSDKAKKRQQDEMGTLGSGNHYLEVQHVVDIYDEKIAAVFGIKRNDIVISIHCGSRGLGHQIGTDFLKKMVLTAAQYKILLPDRELACSPLNSSIGQSYLGAMRCGINCALANRQIITHLTRYAVRTLFPNATLNLLYDVSHNTCKSETHTVNGRTRKLFIHRKGATRAYGPGHPDIPEPFRQVGQPVLIGGSMGTCSYILAGSEQSEQKAFSSACHGAGRSMSRRRATKQWRGKNLIEELAHRGIIIRSPSLRGVAEEAPLAYKDVSAVVDSADKAGLSRKVAKLEPVVCVKG